MIELKKDVQEQIDQSVRIRSVVWLLLAVSLLMSGALFFSATRFFNTYDGLEEATEMYSKCQRAMSRFQEASGNLTNQMRLYAVTGEKEYLDGYFREASSQRRDNALLTFQEYISSESLLSSANEAMEDSNDLMQEEYYIMFLAAKGRGVPEEELREELKPLQLRWGHEELSPEEMTQQAIDLAFGKGYNDAREKIDDETRTFLNDLLQDLSAQREDYKTQLQLTERVTYGLIIVSFGSVCLAFAVIFRLVILPLIRCSDLIERQRLLPIHGSREMRVLAANYNHMLEKHLARQEQLSYANDHDTLTGAYSRAVFDRFCQDPGTDEPIAMLLVDLDYFKRINDSFGHNVGDKVLKRSAELLMGAFRSGDLVCRIGGDEFAAVLFNMTPSHQLLLEEKLMDVEARLKRPGDDDVPPCSLSIGVAFGSAKNAKALQVDADTAMYRAKKAGRGTVVFY